MGTVAAKKYDLLIFEDRKFADIGRVSKFQMAGFYDIRSWADIVTSHSISGPDVTLIFTFSSFAIIFAKVVFPSPGGPANST